MLKTVVIALGGNALLRAGQSGTYDEQLENVAATCESLAGLVERGYNLVIGHGNGPQVGNVLLQHEAGRKEFGLQAMPMEFCVAETQGSIGYMIERTMHNILRTKNVERNVVTLLTEVVVDRNDPRFANPTKPVGPYYTKEEADAFAAKDGSVFAEDPKGRGWRKVVPSPTPLRINNVEIVKKLAADGNIVIASGGGGIPVYDEGGMFHGVEAVIDKDLASALMAIEIGAEELYILTDVPKVYLNFRKPNEVALDCITVAQAEEYIVAGHFSEGSMLPKVRAALSFVKNGGRECVITEASQLGNASCGTKIVP
jgi:carbamate kinase